MRVLHICLCGPVTDNWNYQDNLLTKYHKKLGYDVTILTSKWIWNESGNLVTTNKLNYINDDGVNIIRIPLKGRENFNKKFKKYNGIYKTIKLIEPNIIFIHGCQFLDIKYIEQYAKYNKNVKIYVDNHADYSNSATNWISKNILHKIIWKRCAQKIAPYTIKFYGVLPARVNFLIDVYKLPREKVELLVMGVDDEEAIKAKKENQINLIRKKNNIAPKDFLIMTGGKIDEAKKQTLLLMEAVKEINRTDIKLIIFGSVHDELKEQVNKLTDGDKIQYIGWVKPEESLNYFAAADLVVFPGRHSVFWEQVIGLGIPSIFKRWDGTTHVDVGGNCRFLVEDSVEEIKRIIEELIANPPIYIQMKEVAVKKGMQEFSYRKIAEKSLN